MLASDKQPQVGGPWCGAVQTGCTFWLVLSCSNRLYLLASVGLFKLALFIFLASVGLFKLAVLFG